MGEIVKLQIQNHQYELPVKEYQGQRVVTFKDIDQLHQRPEGTAKRNFNQNQKHFIEGEDYFKLTYEQMRSTNFVPQPNPQGLILITESGYLMLVKSFTDDLAWEVQRKLINNYFRAKQIEADLKQLSPQLQVLISLELRQKQLEEEQKQFKEEQKQLKEKTQILEHRIDNIDNINLIGDLRQRLNAMIRKYANKKGIAYSIAWNEFKQRYNTAFNTNLELSISWAKKKTGLKKINIPQYLSMENKLEDAIRVADKMLNN